MIRTFFRVGGLSLIGSATRASANLSLIFSGRLWDWLISLVRSIRRVISTAITPSKTNPESTEIQGLTPEDRDFARQVSGLKWYHTHDFGGGIKTRGQFDHAPILDKYCLPADFFGKRVLDVATFDGFWAFEFERRGAREVLALDLDRPAELDWPPRRLAAATAEELAVKFGQGFEIAKVRFGSSVRRVCCNVYQLEPDTMGMFDVVHSGDLLLHLSSPVRALQNMAKVCEGFALISEVYAPELDSLGQGRLLEYLGGRNDVTWWKYSLSALEQMILDAGFARVEILAKFRYGQVGMPESMHHVVFKAWKS